MISITKQEINIKDGNKPILEITGLSTDTKPTEDISQGSRFIEIDTGKIYMYDAENQEWKEF